jgi:hypothetical protein
LEEHVTSVFRVEEQAKQETSLKLAASRATVALCLFTEIEKEQFFFQR